MKSHSTDEQKITIKKPNQKNIAFPYWTTNMYGFYLILLEIYFKHFIIHLLFYTLKTKLFPRSSHLTCTKTLIGNVIVFALIGKLSFRIFLVYLLYLGNNL
jgi:hypothetical protein